MKYLVVTLLPTAQNKKGATERINWVCRDIALYNGGNFGNPDQREADPFIEATCKASKFVCEKLDDANFAFGRKTPGGYEQYGKITKIVTLN